MRRLLLLPLLLLATGCELTLDIEVPRADQVLVVDAPFEVGQPWRVGLSSSVSVQSYDNGLRGVIDATVEVYQGDVLLERLIYCDTSTSYCAINVSQAIYYVGQTSPEAGVAYTLRVRHPDFPEVTATDTAPLPITRDQLAASATTRRGEYNSSILDTRLEIADGPNASYYALRLTQQADESSPEETVDTGFRSSSPVFVRANSDPFDQGTEGYYQTGYFTDDAFENQRYTLRLESSTYQQCFPTEVIECTYSYPHANVYAISRAYFNYAKSFVAYEALGGDDNPLGEPVRITSNVEGGLGFFAGRARTTLRVEEQ